MIKVITMAAAAFAITTSAYAMTAAPTHGPSTLVTEVAFGCGPGRTRVNGICVARTTVRHVRRDARRCAFWNGGVCGRWVY